MVGVKSVVGVSVVLVESDKLVAKFLVLFQEAMKVTPFASLKQPLWSPKHVINTKQARAQNYMSLCTVHVMECVEQNTGVENRRLNPNPL